MQAISSGLYVEASGIANDVTNMIERVIQVKLNQSVFVGTMYDNDDVAQEIRFYLYKAADSIDLTRKPDDIFYYLMQCANMRIGQLRRGVYSPNNPPCKICAAGGACRPDGSQCQAWLRYKKTLEIKQNIDNPCSITGIDVVQSWDASGPIQAKELEERIIAALPPHLLRSYHDLVRGLKVTATNKAKIRSIVKDLIDGETTL